MCMKKFNAEKLFFDKQYAVGGYQVSGTYCQVSLYVFQATPRYNVLQVLTQLLDTATIFSSSSICKYALPF